MNHPKDLPFDDMSAMLIGIGLAATNAEFQHHVLSAAASFPSHLDIYGPVSVEHLQMISSLRRKLAEKWPDNPSKVIFKMIFDLDRAIEVATRHAPPLPPTPAQAASSLAGAQVA